MNIMSHPVKATPAKRGSRLSSRGRFADGTANPIDTHVGARVRLRRTLLGLSQEKLGEALGLTFQQVQKYERGANRIGCSRLFDLSRVLDVPVSFFFDDMADEIQACSPAAVATGQVTAAPAGLPDPGQRRDVLELTRDYVRLPRHHADAVRRLVTDLAAAGEDE